MNLDPEIHRFLAGSFDDPEAHRREVMGRIARPVPAGLGYWSFMEKVAPSVFCGYVSLIPVEHRGPEVEIGWRMPRACWGRGLMTEAAAAILRYGFDDLGLDRVLALIHPQNERSIRAAQRLGMRPAGLRVAYGFEMAVYAAGRAATQASGTPTPAPAAG